MIEGEQPLALIGVALAWALATFGIAALFGYFRSPERGLVARPSFKDVAIGFSLLFSAAVFVIPVIYFLVVWQQTGFIQRVDQAGPIVKGWAQVSGLGALALIVPLHMRWMPRTLWTQIWAGVDRLTARRVTHDSIMALITLVVAYPSILLMNQLVKYLIGLFEVDVTLQQVVVSELAEVVSYPALFWSFAFCIVVVVPVVEEWLFRGILLGWMVDIMSRRTALALSSLIFALAHFATAQGLGNIELIATLWVFSLFLGFIYLRQQSLLASIVLHSLFNAVTVIYLLQSTSYTHPNWKNGLIGL